jgi:hypothetical protein
MKHVLSLVAVLMASVVRAAAMSTTKRGAPSGLRRALGGRASPGSGGSKDSSSSSSSGEICVSTATRFSQVEVGLFHGLAAVLGDEFWTGVTQPGQDDPTYARWGADFWTSSATCATTCARTCTGHWWTPDRRRPATWPASRSPKLPAAGRRTVRGTPSRMGHDATPRPSRHSPFELDDSLRPSLFSIILCLAAIADIVAAACVPLAVRGRLLGGRIGDGAVGVFGRRPVLSTMRSAALSFSPPVAEIWSVVLRLPFTVKQECLCPVPCLCSPHSGPKRTPPRILYKYPFAFLLESNWATSMTPEHESNVHRAVLKIVSPLQKEFHVSPCVSCKSLTTSHH